MIKIQKNKIILGIDAALRHTGYCIAKTINNNGLKILTWGIIKNHPSYSCSKCLLNTTRSLKDIIYKLYIDENLMVDTAIIEDIFHGINTKTMILLGYVKGSLITMLSENNIKMYSYPPREVKKAVSGSGDSTKNEIAQYMSKIFNINLQNIKDDITDALSLILCHIRYDYNKISNKLQ